MTRHDTSSREHLEALAESRAVTSYNEHVDELEAEVLQWVVLLDLESHSDLGMCFGDAGKLQFVIRLDDLRALRFDKTELMVWST